MPPKSRGPLLRGTPDPLPLRPVSRSRTFEEVLNQIEPLIRQGRLRLGTRLPSERELARSLGVSRTSLREAIRVLTVRGMLESKPGLGTFVHEPSADRLATLFASALSRKGIGLPDVMEFRRALEPAVAASAALRAGPREIENLEAIVDRHTRRVRAGEPAVLEDGQFHNALAAATRNPVFVRVVDQCLDLIQETRKRVLQTRARARLSLRAHLRILEAVRQRDPDAARDAMTAHLLEVESLIGKVRRGSAS